MFRSSIAALFKKLAFIFTVVCDGLRAKRMTSKGFVRLLSIALLGALTLGRSKSVKHSRRDVEALTRMVIAETSGREGLDETRSIVQVAVNRSMVSGRSLEDTVSPPGVSTAGVWNSGDKYRAQFERAMDYPESQVARSRKIVQSVLSGDATNLIGTRLNFIHPKRMDAPVRGECLGTRVTVKTTFGDRCVPSWAGRESVQVGNALFSNPPKQ